MNYRHLSIEERSCIRKYYVDGLSYREIARLIGRNVSTVSREIRRNCTHMYDIPTYYPHTAQKKYLLRRSYCHRGMVWNEDIIAYIEEKLKATWSPDGHFIYRNETEILRKNNENSICSSEIRNKMLFSHMFSY